MTKTKKTTERVLVEILRPSRGNIELNAIEIPFDVEGRELSWEEKEQITELICEANPSVEDAEWNWRWYDGDSERPFVIYLI